MAELDPGLVCRTIVKIWSWVPSSTPSRIVASEMTPPVLKCLKPLNTISSPSLVISRSALRAWIHGSADEPVIGQDELLDAVLLLVSPNDAGGR